MSKHYFDVYEFSNLKTIGEKIKKARKEKKITQKELGKLISKTSSSIQKYEYGLTSIPLEVLEKIAKVLQLPLNHFLPIEYQDTEKEELEEYFEMETARKRYEIQKFLEHNYNLKDDDKRLLSKMISDLIDILIDTYVNRKDFI